MMDLSTLSPRLRENQAKSIRVVLTPELSTDVITEWIGALEVNESLTHVQVVCCGDMSRHQAWKSLVVALLSVPHLQHFQLRGVSPVQEDTKEEELCVVPVSLFAQLPFRLQELQSFSLAHLILTAQGPRDFQALSHWLLKTTQKALQDFQLIGIGLEAEQADGTGEDYLTTKALEPLLSTLASFPRLSNLEISGTVTPLGLLEQVPEGLFESKSLERLSISDFILSPTALSSLCAIGATCTIQELAIAGDLTREVAPKLTQFLLQKNSSLHSLALRMDNLKDEQVNQELIRAIGSSHHLKVVSLCSFCGDPLSVTSRMAIADMLRKNCRLEYLYVPCPYTDTVFWDQVRLYLGLNAAGRRHLLSSSSSQDDAMLAEAEEKKDDTAPSSPEQERLKLVRSEIDNVFQYLKTTSGPSNILSSDSSTTTKKRPRSCSSSSATVVKRVTLRSTLKPPTVKSMARGSHKQLVHKARASQKQKRKGYVSHHHVVPIKGLSSMFITRS